MTPSPEVTLCFVGGDVMCGRGVDQILAFPSEPTLHEAWVRSALRYVELAERAHGPVPRGVPPAYVWGDVLEELEHLAPAARVVNLETAVTTSATAWRGKGIHYRMHPRNVACLAVARLDVCGLANNHVLDWGRDGLVETLDTLRAAGIATAGAGADAPAAASPAIVPLPRRRLLVYACGALDSGIPRNWAATSDRAGVNMLPDYGADEIEALATRIAAERRAGDLVVVSVHWGPNRGYEITAAERNFAHGLIDAAGVDVVHGHSSHHAKAIEVHRRRPILYGCGDLLTDYEGIGGEEEYRGDLSAFYLPTLCADTGRLRTLELLVTRVCRLQVQAAPLPDLQWFAHRLDRECRAYGTHVERSAEHRLAVHWS